MSSPPRTYKQLPRLALALALAGAASLAPAAASAFCGFYVGGAGARLFNHATRVALLREGTRTVLSMENSYEGPPERFAMVVPVPVVLQKEQVKVLSRELFERVDQLSAPRLVEYWESDPCQQDEYGYEFSDDPLSAGGFGPNDATIRVRSAAPPVRVLNRFTAGEYQIVILGADDSLSLETWLRQNGYHIPAGAEPLLRPYVQGGMKFFVAKVDPAKVRFERGMATLSPIRFHYDAEAFSLPIRLGMVNSAGKQDLIVHLLGRQQRYEVANYPNVTVPTNLDVNDTAKERFGAFYAALFDKTLAENPGAVVTEYAWGSSSCDPCPGPVLEADDILALGVETLPQTEIDRTEGYVLTRLHLRYDRGAISEDLVFRAAPPIVGGREARDAGGALEAGARQDSMNFFQARYAIRHAWGGPVGCEDPRRGRWGGGPGAGSPPAVARELAFAPREGVELGSFLGPGSPTVGERWLLPPALHRAAPAGGGGCAGCRVGGGEAGWAALAAVAALSAAMTARRRRG